MLQTQNVYKVELIGMVPYWPFHKPIKMIQQPLLQPPLVQATLHFLFRPGAKHVSGSEFDSLENQRGKIHIDVSKWRCGGSGSKLLGTPLRTAVGKPTMMASQPQILAADQWTVSHV